MADNSSTAGATTVLPAEGSQPLYDMVWQAGQAMKQQVVWFIGGIAVGIALAYWLNLKHGRK